MIQDEFYKKIKLALSVEKLENYGKKDNADDLLVFARYLHNIALCEALYSPLQLIEVALRNSISQSLKAKYGDDFFDKTPFSTLQEEDLDEAKKKLKRKGKLETNGALIAELNFGFWTSFFNKENEKNGLAFTAAKAFKKAPKSERKISSLFKELNDIRQLRNRVFHHERIVHWRDLKDKHDKILKMIAYLSPKLHELTLELDRFSKVYNEGVEVWTEKILTHWSAEPEEDPNNQSSNS